MRPSVGARAGTLRPPQLLRNPCAYRSPHVAPRTRSRRPAWGLVVAVALMVLGDGGAGGHRLVRPRQLVPAAARRVGPARRPGHGPRARAGGARVPARGRASRNGCRGGGCCSSSFVAGLAWMLALAFVDGSHGVEQDPRRRRTSTSAPPGDDGPARDAAGVRQPDPLRGRAATTGRCTSPVIRPGALTFFVLLVRLGLGSGFAAGPRRDRARGDHGGRRAGHLRALGAERLARRAAPFLVLGPGRDLAVRLGRRGVRRRRRLGHRLPGAGRDAAQRARWSVLAGLLLGYGVMMSYGLPLLGVLAVAVLVAARSWFPLAFAVVAAVAVVAAFWAFGFSYLEALPAIHSRYYEGVGGRRPVGVLDVGRPGRAGLRRRPPGGIGRRAAPRRRPRPAARHRDAHGAVALRCRGGDGAAGRPLPDEPGRGRADLAAVRAVAAGPAPCCPSGGDAAVSPCSSGSRWSCSTCSSPAGDRGRSSLLAWTCARPS